MADRQTQEIPFLDKLKDAALRALVETNIPKGLGPISDIGNAGQFIAGQLGIKPPEELGKIRVVAPSQAPSPQSPQIPEAVRPGGTSNSGIPSTPSPFIPQLPDAQGGNIPQPEAQEAQPNKFMEFMKAMGVPLAATGIGMGVPGALPGAAGFSKGYVGQQEILRKSRIKNQDIFDKAKVELEKEQRGKDEKRDFERFKMDLKGTKPPANVVKQQKSIKSARNVISVLQQQLSKIKPVSGPAARFKGAALNISGAVGADPVVSTFNNLRKSVLGQMAKIVSGESGRLTDQDIARIEAAIPRITDTKEERALAFSLLEQILSESEAIFASGTSDSGDTTTTGIGNIDQQIADIDRQIADLERRQ